MEVQLIPFNQVPQFSAKDIAYATQDSRLKPFFKYAVTEKSFEQVIADKQKDHTDRELLVRVLEAQYSSIPTSAAVKENIRSLLSTNTFTLVTAHQPSLLTGPLYYIYKIVSTIKLAKNLKESYPDYHFVPVFVSGGEDHDFEEVNHVHLFGKTLVWENDEKGSVGMMSTQSLAKVLDELKEILGNGEHSNEILEKINTAYTGKEPYSRATLELVDSLFREEGLVVLNMNQPELKRAFIPVMEEELFEQSSREIVEATQQELEAAGFSGQAHVREINLFYLREQLRERIIQEGEQYRVNQTDFVFTAAELREELHNHPEHFSPNVVMRPLYQEKILPNLAYIGGGGEIAYWLERKKQFEHFGINFPMLIRRNSVLWLDKGTVTKIEKLELSLPELFADTEDLIKAYVEKNSAKELDLSEEKESIARVFEQVLAKGLEIDPTLEKPILGEKIKLTNSFEQLEGKLMRAEKKKHETAINQIRSIKDKLCPGNGLQERYDNFLPYYLKYGNTFFSVLMDNLDPLKEGMVVILDK